MNHSVRVTMSYKYVIQEYICEVNALAYILRAMAMNAFSISNDSGGMQYHTIMYYFLHM